MYLICHRTSDVYLTERACEFMGGNSFCFVTTLSNLVTISTAMVEI